MTNREQCEKLLDGFTESQLLQIAALLQAAKRAMEEAADDAFCSALLEEYKADADKGTFVSIEDAARALGVSL